ncbi:hypothetical protein [Candidatus Poriferisocius sp.]|uniref:hypothetical protein n=1 Tax=Candidatus Poriferisocius sp. TaxID=3101276 RepID=UPI003B0192AD
MPLQQTSVPDHVKEALSSYPSFSADVEWLREVSGQPDPDTDGDILQVVLTVIENALSEASPMLGTQEWHRLANCLGAVRSSYPQDRESLLYTLQNHAVIARGGPLLVAAETNPVPAASSLVEAMKKGRRAVGDAKRSVESAAQQSRSAIDDAVRKTEDKAGQSRDAMDGAVREIEEQQSQAMAQLTSLLEDLQDRYGFTVGATLGGSHEAAAEAEKALMDQHTKSARWAQLGAVVWAMAVVILKLAGVGPSGWDGHLISAPLLGGPVAILVYLSSSETRAAKVHRHNHARWLGLSLQLKSLRPYIDDLALKAQPKEGEREAAWKDDLLGEVSSKIFKGDIGPYEAPPRGTRRRELRPPD